MTSHWVRPSSYQSLSCVDATTSASGTLGGRTWANIVPDIAPGEHAHRPGVAPAVLTVGVAQLVLCFPRVYAKQFVFIMCVESHVNHGVRIEENVQNWGHFRN